MQTERTPNQENTTPLLDSIAPKNDESPSVLAARAFILTVCEAAAEAHVAAAAQSAPGINVRTIDARCKANILQTLETTGLAQGGLVYDENNTLVDVDKLIEELVAAKRESATQAVVEGLDQQIIAAEAQLASLHQRRQQLSGVDDTVLVTDVSVSSYESQTLAMEPVFEEPHHTASSEVMSITAQVRHVTARVLQLVGVR